MPVSYVDHDTYGRPDDLPEVSRAILRVVGYVFAAIFRDWSDVDLGAGGLIDNSRKRMLAQVVVDLRPPPLLRIQALGLLHIFIGRTQAGEKHFIALLNGVVAEHRIRTLQRLQHNGRIRIDEGIGSRLR